MSRAQVRQQWRARFRGDTGFSSSAQVSVVGKHRTVARRKPDVSTESLGLSIRIQHLDCRGVGRLNEEQVIGAMGTELKALIAARGTPGAWEHDWLVSHVHSEGVERAARMTADSLGTRVGRAIYELRGTDPR